MPLLGPVAMLLSFDIAPEAISEHDDWHSHEHLPERLSIPGFLRGTRWVAVRGEPRYCVLYEVAALAVLTSEAYLERLNHPTPWTASMMRHYRGMSRGFCNVSGSFGAGMGPFARLLRFKPQAGATTRIRNWLLESALPLLPPKPGICSVHLLEGAATPAMTNEQRIRGNDSGVDWAILITGYEEDVLARLDQSKDLDLPRLEREVTNLLDATYRIAHSLSRNEL